MRKSMLASTAIAFVLGGILINPPKAWADLPVIDPVAIAESVKSFAQETGILDVLTAMQAVQSTINDTMKDVSSALGGTTFGDTNTLLQQGFTQLSNYSKASVDAMTQIFDASNTANARFTRDVRNREISDQHTVNQNHCIALDGGVSTQSAAVQAFAVGATIAAVHDQRGEAGLGMPSYYSAAQGVGSMAQNHIASYCDATDAAAGLCPSGVSPTPNADQRASSLFGSNTYTTQLAINAAKDYATNLIQPVAPAALRGDQLTSVAGQEAALQRRSYNARISMAQTFVDGLTGMQTPSVPLTPVQTAYLAGQGLPAQTTGSWLQVLQIEAERRVSDLTWNSNLHSMPPASVEREVALELALSNYLAFQNLKVQLQHTTMTAAQLAANTEYNFQPAVPMPTPNMASTQTP